MKKTMCLVGAGIILGSMAGPVEARVVRYQINDKVYFYSTRNRQQVERARQRIAAANAAYVARVRADAELARSPVARVLGSPAQKEAAAAQARFEQVLSEKEPAPSAAAPAAAPAEHLPTRKAAKAERVRRLSAVKATPNLRLAGERTQVALNAGPDGLRPAEPPSEAPLVPGVPLSPAPQWTNLQKPALKSITFDLFSGIKSVQMTDGTVREEPLDSSIVSTLRLLEPEAGSLNSFVEQLRTDRPLEVTVTPPASPDPTSIRPE